MDVKVKKKEGLFNEDKLDEVVEAQRKWGEEPWKKNS